jgi:hypothetical protein
MNNNSYYKDQIHKTQNNQLSAGLIGRAWSGLLGRLLHLSINETRVATRGFQVDSPEIVARIESIGTSFATGYNYAVASSGLESLVHVLELVPLGERGFAYEGAAMGLAITDWMTPGRAMFENFLNGPANHHEYIVWVGLGWSFARLPISPLNTLSRFCTPNKWLALDGYGFHEGYFGWQRSIIKHNRPRSLTGDAAKIFDQGLGRSLWFVLGASPKAIATSIETFDPDRAANLWAGVGLAATYAGGVDRLTLAELKFLAASNFPSLAQGVVFAAEARRRAGNPVPHSEESCEEVLGMTLAEAADIATECFPRYGHDVTAYQKWRTDVQSHFISPHSVFKRNSLHRGISL